MALGCDILLCNQDQNAKADDTWSPNTLQSKFAGWFLEEGKALVKYLPLLSSLS